MRKGILAILVIGLLVLVVAVIWWDSWKPFVDLTPNTGRLADKILCDGILNAVNVPNNIVVSKDLKLLKGVVYTTRSFANCGNMEENCVEIQASDSSTFSVNERMVIQINSLIQTDVYYKCVLGTTVGVDMCPLFCTVSFGKELS